MESKETRLRAWHRSAKKMFMIGCAVAGLLGTGAAPALAQARAAFIVQSDRGGWLNQRSKEIRQFRSTGQRVELRGTCLSACTMYLSLPGTCVSRNATLGFHGPSRNGQPLSRQDFDHWSRVMASNYREPLRTWFMNEGRHRTSGYHRISGVELIRMGYTEC